MAYEGNYDDFDYEDEYGIDAPQGPCEFCNLLFPLHMLIEHETGCDPEMTSYGLEPVQPPPPPPPAIESRVEKKFPSQAINAIIAPEIDKLKIEQVEKIAIDVKKAAEILQTQSAAVYMLEEAQKEAEDLRKTSARTNVIKQIKDMQFQRQKTEEFDVKGETLMSFGASEDPNKDLEKSAHQEYMEQAEDIEDINNLSDDDCSETLEEFWKRANEVLKRQRVKNC